MQVRILPRSKYILILPNKFLFRKFRQSNYKLKIGDRSFLNDVSSGLTVECNISRKKEPEMPRKGAQKLFLKEEHKLCKDPPSYIWKIIFRKQDKQSLVKSKYSTNVIISITFSKHLSKYFPVVHKPKLRRKSDSKKEESSSMVCKTKSAAKYELNPETIVSSYSD